ncbi:hypothetical protein ASD99_14875 [Mesorhizobium sp. Root695]|uniref:hypothetical protein n=1 Tax=Mesorhizobium sp. Root695 TaxID=1736589 RepID=UPI00070CFB2E|nr:hypothetical protein [Mesorhizobium sp. Root695]KRB13951.1 hypothetical protein ASD99_14875 [Mesorhizobium sp. Root695]
MSEDDNVTFGQLRACLQAAREVLDGTIANGELKDRIQECCGQQSAEYRFEMIDLTGMLVGFGEHVRGN